MKKSIIEALISTIYTAVDNLCTVHIMLVKFGVPTKQVYQYDYHVKNLIIGMIA